MRHPIRELIDLAAVGRMPPSVEELEAHGLNEHQVESVLSAARHASDLYAAGNNAAARSVAQNLDAWFPGDLAKLGAPPPVDPLANETDPRVLGAAAGRNRL